MAKVDDFRRPGWDKPPLPLRAPKPSEAPRSFLNRLSLRHIMVALVYFAGLFWAVRQVTRSEGAIQLIILAVVAGLGLCVFGLWAVMRLPRYSFLGWVVFVVGYMAITLGTTSFFALPTLPILIGAIVYLSLRRRSNDQDSLLWVMSVAADRGMPLAPGVQAFSGQVTGIFELWAESLAEVLRRGATLPEALDDLPKLVPASSALLIRTGWEAGSLASGLRQAVDAREKRSPVLRTFGARIAYLLWILCIMQGIVGFVMYFIVPKLEAIFKDFGIELPEVTIMVIRASHIFVDYAWLYTLGVLGFVSYLIVAFFGMGSLSVPVVDRLFARRHSILILRALSVVVEAGRPIGSAKKLVVPMVIAM